MLFDRYLPTLTSLCKIRVSTQAHYSSFLIFGRDPWCLPCKFSIVVSYLTMVYRHQPGTGIALTCQYRGSDVAPQCHGSGTDHGDL